jgi:putative transposase
VPREVSKGKPTTRRYSPEESAAALRIDVAVPKLRAGSYFPDWLLTRRRRAKAALTSVG